MATQSDTLLCSPCETSHRPAIQYCLDCDELLCEVCTDCHKKFKSTKDHNLVRCEERDDYEGARLLSKSLLCPRHSDKFIEVRCAEHNDLCCITCATIIHRKCNTIEEVKNLGGGLKSEKETKIIQKRITATKDCIEEILERNNNVYQALETSADAVPETLQDIQNSLAKLYEAIQKHIMEKVKGGREDVRGITDARQEVWGSRLKDTNDLAKMFDTVLNIGSESQVFIAVETIKSKLEQIKEHIEAVDKSRDIKEQVFNLQVKNELKNFLRADVDSCVELDLSERAWCHYPQVSRLLKDVSDKEENKTSDFLNEELYPALGNVNDKVSGRTNDTKPDRASKTEREKKVKNPMPHLTRLDPSDENSDSDSDPAGTLDHFRFGRGKDKGHKKEKTAKMRNAKGYRQGFR